MTKKIAIKTNHSQGNADTALELSIERTELALERTQLSCIRTAMGLQGSGIALDKGMELVHKTWLEAGNALFENTHVIGIVLSIAGTLCEQGFVQAGHCRLSSPELKPNKEIKVHPPRRKKPAFRQARTKVQRCMYVITLDIKSYFDTIPHDKLLKAVQFYCKQKWVSLYVSRWLKASIINEDGSTTQPRSGTPQGGVISPLLSNLYLHVVFDGWMLQNYPGIRFERYADDIIIHARREQIAQSILNKLQKRFTECGLTIHPTKTQIVCLTRSQTNRSVTSVNTFEMGDFVFTPQWVKEEGERKLLILPTPSKSARKSIMDKIRSLRLHTRTGSIYVVVLLLDRFVSLRIAGSVPVR